MPKLNKFINGQFQRFHSKVILKFNSLNAKTVKKKNFENKSTVTLPQKIWEKILSYSSIIDLLKLRRVCKLFEAIVSDIFSNTIYMNLYKIDAVDMDTEIDCAGTYDAFGKAHFLLELEDRRITMLLQEQCTARDVVSIFGAISYFGKFVQSLTADAAIFELIIAGLSSMDLTRWHAFQCYLKVLNHNDLEDTIHVHCIKRTSNALLLPKLTELTICVPVDEISCLSRFMDYGVSSNSIYSCRNLCLLRLNLPNYLNFLPYADEASYVRRYNQHIRSFRHWSNAATLQERYTQRYC